MSEKDTAAVEPRHRRKIRTGVVTSDKMEKTVTVMITRRTSTPGRPVRH